MGRQTAKQAIKLLYRGFFGDHPTAARVRKIIPSGSRVTISAGADVVTVSRQLGRSKPDVTLGVYSPEGSK